MRTGDLGFFSNGVLFVAGRIKDLIIIDGRNYYPQDIELTVEQSHRALRKSCCAAFSIEVGGQERVVVVGEVDKRYNPGTGQGDGAANLLNPRDVIKTIIRAVAEINELPVYDTKLIKAGSIPKTSSGKIQRSACRALYIAGDLQLWEGGNEDQ